MTRVVVELVRHSKGVPLSELNTAPTPEIPSALLRASKRRPRVVGIISVDRPWYPRGKVTLKLLEVISNPDASLQNVGVLQKLTKSPRQARVARLCMILSRRFCEFRVVLAFVRV